jgi:putative PEP-CTERM system histidine kinase
MGDDTRLEGFILLGRLIKPDENYIYEDFDLMKTYARQAYQTIRQHRLAQALLFSREEAAIGNVATFIMHDLKNQLAAISLITENAPHLISNPDYQKDLVVSLQSTVKNMQSLIGNLKTLHKDKLLHLEQVDLMDLVEDCTLLLPGNQITVFGNREFATVDRNEIQKVVMNLLVNGIEASDPDKPIDVEVGASTVDGHLFIRVQDRGYGMTQEFLKSELFVPFNTTKSSGLGIGLFQSRQIVQAHGGKIVVESSPETGSTFTIWLPRSGVLHVTT